MFDAASMRDRYQPSKPTEKQLKKIDEFQNFLYNTLISIDKIADKELEIKVGIKAEFYEASVAEFEKLGYNIRAVKETFEIKNHVNPFEPPETGYLQYSSHDLAMLSINRIVRDDPERMVLTLIDWRRKS